MSVPQPAAQWIIQELESHGVQSPRFSASHDLKALRIKDLALLYKALERFSFFNRKRNQCKSIHSANNKGSKVAVLRSYFYLDDKTTVDEPVMDELRNDAHQQQSATQQQQQAHASTHHQQQAPTQQQPQNLAHSRAHSTPQQPSSTITSPDSDFQFALRLQREEDEQYRMQQQARGGSQPFVYSPAPHAILNGGMFLPHPSFVLAASLLPHHPFNVAGPQQIVAASAATSHLASISHNTPPAQYISPPNGQKRQLPSKTSSSPKKKQKTSSSRKPRSPKKQSTSKPDTKVKAEPMSHVEEQQILEESTPQNDQERKLLGELKQMGFTDDSVILQGIRHCQSKSVTQYMTSDAVMMYLVQRREEMDEAKKMDQARIESERQRKLEAARLRAAAREEAQATMRSSSLKEWKSVFFQSSWILNQQNAFSVLCRVGEDVKSSLLKLLEVEAKAAKWYKKVPQQFFQFAVTKRIASLEGDPKGLRDFLNTEIGKIEHAMFTLEEQKGGVPKLFLQAQQFYADETTCDDDVCIVEDLAARPQSSQIEFFL